MRELVVENQEVLIVPQNYKFANRGIVKQVNAGDFILELDFPADGILVNTFCEFYTQTPHGKLYFDSYAKSIDGKTLIIASPAKHKFLQRRQFTRIKYVNNLDIIKDGVSYPIKTLDISAGGMKFVSKKSIDIDGVYSIRIPITENVSVDCNFSPIRMEKVSNDEYLMSGQFSYKQTADRMQLTQYCVKRSIEIKNK